MSSLHVIMVSTTRSDGKSRKKTQKEKAKRKTKTWDWLKQHKFQQKKLLGFCLKLFVYKSRLQSLF